MDEDQKYSDLLTEHAMVGGVVDGEFILQMHAWPAETLQDEVDHFYPGAIVDEFGMVQGGWPTNEELVENRREHGRRSVWAVVRDWVTR